MQMYNLTYLSAEPDTVLRTTGLALDELEALVGRYGKQSSRAGKLRGELREYPDGTLEIYKHFPLKRVWSSGNNL